MKSNVEFVETIEFRRFTEFCEACTRHRYIGLCHGPAGIGKTISARRYADWNRIGDLNLSLLTDEQVNELGEPTIVLYTAPVTNTPKVVESSISLLRRHLERIAREPLQRKVNEALLSLLEEGRSGRPARFPVFKKSGRYAQEVEVLPDPTALILIDEADRLTMQSLEQVRSIFDEADVGLVLIGMPGLEKKLSRYAQFYSRVGFVHEFRPLNATEVARILGAQGWTPIGVKLPPLDDEIISTITRVTNGNFRLIDRLLTQIGRIIKINGLEAITAEVVEAARDTLVIGK